MTTNCLSAQEENIIGKVKSVKEKAITLEKINKFERKKLEPIIAEYGEFGIYNPSFTEKKAIFLWKKTLSNVNLNFIRNYNANGTIKNETWYDSFNSFNTRFEYLYNKNDSIIKFQKKYIGGKLLIKNYTYDYNNNKISEMYSYSDDIDNYGFLNYKYNKNKKLTDIQRFNRDEGYISSNLYKYNSRSKLSEQLYFKPPNYSSIDTIGEKRIIRKYFYDEKSNLIKIIYFLSANKIYMVAKNSYDSNLIQTSEYYSSGRYNVKKYFYNENNQKIKDTYSTENIFSFLSNQFNFYQIPSYLQIDFNQIFFFDEDDNIYNESFFEDNRIVKLIVKNKFYQKTVTFDYKFDKKGNWIVQTKSIDGIPKFQLKRKIKYYNE